MRSLRWFLSLFVVSDRERFAALTSQTKESVMEKLVELTRYSTFNQQSDGKALIDPGEVAAVLEVRPARGLESRSTLVLDSGEKIEIYENPDEARKKLGR